MLNKLPNYLWLFTLLGITMWFFGNFYEALVVGPNMLEDSVNRLQAWQKFFVVTNPALYYVPITQLATITLFILYFKTPRHKKNIKNLLQLASIFQVASLLLSVYIITQINFTIFFDDLTKQADKVPALALRWNILNALRVVLTALALRFIFKAYIQNDRLNNRHCTNH